MERLNSHEASWVAELLILLPEVDLLGLRIGWDRMRFGSETVPVVTLDVHARTLLDAEALVSALHLAKVDLEDLSPAKADDPGRVWHSWTGWAHEGSRQAACWVEVTAAERIPTNDTAGDSVAA